jgi:hypothetical protein
VSARPAGTADLLGPGWPEVPALPAPTGGPDRTGWADSGALALTGRPDGPPLPPPGDPAGAAAHLLALWRAATAARCGRLPAAAAAADVRLLGERAALAGLSRRGDVSCGGATRLLPAADGWVALALAREDDRALVPALLGGAVPTGDPWADVAAWLRGQPADAAVERAWLLGLAAASVPSHRPAPAGPVPPGAVRPGVVQHVGGPRPGCARPRVLDLTSLWAGPLAGHLLHLAGCDVVKVETAARPDGARRGTPAFFDLLNAQKRCITVDLADTDLLRRLVRAADVVLEGSRPRALAQLGVDAAAAAAAGTIWASITAHGRDVAGGMRPGFGDDVAAGAGLVAADDDGPVFCGDALADPLAGLATAAAVGLALLRDTGALIDVSMHDVARIAAALPPPPTDGRDAAPPRARPVTAAAAPAGADTAEVLREWLG